MSNNCLITKLMGIVSNNNLRKVNEVKIGVKTGTSFWITRNTINAVTNIRTNGITFKVNGTGEPLTTIAFSGSDNVNLTNISGDGYIFIEKTNFKTIKDSTRIKCDFSEFGGTPLASMYINNENANSPLYLNNIPVSIPLNIITTFGPVDVNNDALGKLTNLSVLQISDCSDLDLFEIAKNRITNGQDTGTITQKDYPIYNASFNGNLLSSGKYTLEWVNNGNNTHTVTLTQKGESEPLYSEVVDF